MIVTSLALNIWIMVKPYRVVEGSREASIMWLIIKDEKFTLI